MRYIERTAEQNEEGLVSVFYTDSGDTLLTCDPYIADSIIYTWNNQKKILAGRRAKHDRQEVYTCEVCGATFTDPFDHIESGNPVHKEYVKMIKISGYSEPCICGSEIKRYEYMGGGWERSCDRCRMIFDSDGESKKLVVNKTWDAEEKGSGENIKTLSPNTMEVSSPQTEKDYFTSGASLTVVR